MKERNLDLYAALFIFILATAATFFVLIHVTGSRVDFYNELWGPAHLLMRGQSPYNTSSLQAELPAVWLPMSIGFFSFLGLFSEQVALRIWFFLSLVQLSLMVWWVMGSAHSVFVTPLVAVLAYFFPPTINHFMLGQFSITVLFCLLAAAYFAEKDCSWLAALFLALGLSKPQLGILAVIGLSIFYFHRSGFKRLILFGSQVILACMLLCLPLFIAYSKWIPDWIESTRSNRYAWLHPSLLAEFQRIMGSWGVVIWVIVLIAVVILTYRIWLENSAVNAMIWSLAFTTLITPYIWSWDFVLLLPLLVLGFATTDWKGKVFLFAAYFAGFVGMMTIQLSANDNNYRFWWVPVWFVGMITLIHFWNRSKQLNERKLPTN